jgi:hypothetical protein
MFPSIVEHGTHNADTSNSHAPAIASDCEVFVATYHHGQRDDNLNPADFPFERCTSYEQMRSNAISTDFTGGGAPDSSIDTDTYALPAWCRSPS